MNHVERVQAAAARRPVDRVPKGEFLVERPFAEAFLRALPEPGEPPAALLPEPLGVEIALGRRIGADLICVHHDLLQTGGAEAGAEALRRAAGEGWFVFSVRNGGFQVLQNERGFREALLAMARDPGGAAAEMARSAAEIARAIPGDVAAGAHGVLIAEDFAYPGGLYISPKILETVLVPCWRQCVAAAREAGVPVFLHSDGDLRGALPAIAEVGFDGVQGLEPAARMDIGAVKAAYGGRLCMMGNLDPALLTPGGPPGARGGAAQPETAADAPFPDLTRAVRDLFGAAAPGGGFIFATCGGLFPGLSPEKVLRAYQLAEQLGGGAGTGGAGA